MSTPSSIGRFILNPFAAVCIAAAGCGDNLGADPAPDGGGVDAPPPPPPSLRVLEYVQAVDVTPDGTVALFGDISTAEGRLWFVDTVTGEAENRTNVGDPLRAFATGIADTQAVSALHGDPVQAGVWTPDGGWRDLPSPHPAGCDLDIAGAWDISADGQVVVGLTWSGCSVEAFRWTATGGGGVQRLARLGQRLSGGSGLPDNRATVVSDDGQVAAGWAMTAVVDRAPARWHADGSGELLPRSADDSPGEVLAISADGGVLAGVDGQDGVVWRDGTRSVLPRLDTLLPSDPVFPNAVTADGTVVFGGQGSAFFGTPEAFVWSEAAGLRRVADLVAAAGLTIPADVTLMNVTGASADGTVLIGTARHGATFADLVFVLRLPADAIR